MATPVSTGNAPAVAPKVVIQKDTSCCNWRCASIALAALGIVALGVATAVYTGNLNISCSYGAMSQVHAQWAMVAGAGVLGLSLLNSMLCGVKECCQRARSSTIEA